MRWRATLALQQARLEVREAQHTAARASQDAAAAAQREQLALRLQKVCTQSSHFQTYYSGAHTAHNCAALVRGGGRGKGGAWAWPFIAVHPIAAFSPARHVKISDLLGQHSNELSLVLFECCP